jgi:hypothetical protein
VGVCLLRDPGEPADPAAGEQSRAADILSAARRAAALNDPRFLRVLDASQSDGLVYVVTEWVKASSLADLLAAGPLSPDEARFVGAEVAAALATAHEDGLVHLCLSPEHVLRTAHGQVKVSGLAVDAAVRGLRPTGPEDAAARDTVGCAAVLYAALTGRWPLDTPSTLSPAPRENDQLCTPRQVRAGVPHDLDDITCRALGGARSAAEPVASPAQLATLLADAQGTARMPVVAPAVPPVGPDDTPYPPVYAAPYDDATRRGRGLATRAAWTLAGLALVVGLALTGYQLVGAAFDSGDSAAGSSAGSGTQRPAATGQPVRVVAAEGFDPPPDGNGEENSDRARRAVDGDTGTVWTTKSYRNPFGSTGIKQGVGLLLDLGRRQQVGSVSVALRGDGADLQLRVADRRGDRVGDYRTVAEAVDTTDDSGPLALRLDGPVQARYLLLWFTALPPVDGSDYRGTVAEVTVRG